MLVEKMSKEELVQYAEGQKRKIKIQNENAKKNWDSVSCRLPKGTVQRVKNHGLTVNGLINRLVLQELERLDGGGNAERQETEKQQETPLERPQEAQEEDKTKTVKESSKDGVKPAEKGDNAVVLAEMQAAKSRETTQEKPTFTATMSEADNRAFLEEQQIELNKKRQEQEERKQKLEQEKKKRKEEEREQNRLEMRRYVENIRDRAKGNQEQKEIVKQFMDDPFLRENVLKPERRGDVVEVVGQEAYDAIIKAVKESKREETKQRERMRELETEVDQGEVPDFMSDL